MGTHHLWRVVAAIGVMLVSGGCAGEPTTAPAVPTPQASLREVLAGRIAGVPAPVRGAQPSAMRIRICRLAGAPMAGRPLLVVDGSVVQHHLAHGLDPKQIVSMEVLKGPAAVELYGPEARDGAILVRTRAGPAAPASADSAAR